MNCQHINEGSSAEAVHTLPCRDTLCMPCLFGISDLFKGNPFSCPLCGNYTQYVDSMIQSILDEANTHRTKQIGQKKEGFATSRIGEGSEGDQRSDEASEHSDWYNRLTEGDPTGVHASDISFATSYDSGGHSCNYPPQSPSISASQQHYRHTCRDHHGWSGHPNLPAVPGTRAHHQNELCVDDGSITIQMQEKLLARCQQNKANAERDFHLNNGRDIPDNYCQSDKGQGTSKADVFCTEHDLSEVYFFCGTCNKPVCGKCVTSTHSKHKYFNFESPGETDSEKQSQFYHDSRSDTSTDLPPSKINRSSESRQGFHQSSKDEDYPLNIEAIDRQEQRKLLEQYEQAKHTTHYDTHVPPQTHGYNLRSRSTCAGRYSETEVAQVEAVASKGEDRFCKDHPGSEVYFFCKTCDTPVCGKCTAEEHRNHKYDKFDKSEDEKTNEVMCDVHKLPCIMYCEKCNVIICTSCSTEYLHHRSHYTWSLDKDRLTDKFMKYVKTLQKNTEECNKLKESSAKGKEKIQKETDELKEKVMKATQRAKEQLDSIAAEHIAQIEDELAICMKPREDFDVKIANMEKELKDNEETISTAWQLITDNDLSKAALAASSVNDSLQKFTKTKQRISQPSGGLGLLFRVNGITHAPFSVLRSSYFGGTYSRITHI